MAELNWQGNSKAMTDKLIESSPKPFRAMTEKKLMEGLANKVIAKRINVSTRTVESRRQRIFEKTGTGSLAELVQHVVELRSPSSKE